MTITGDKYSRAFFAFAGVILIWKLVATPLYKYFQVSTWDLESCLIYHNKIVQKKDEDGYYYEFHVAYKFDYNDKEHTSNIYNFLGSNQFDKEIEAIDESKEYPVDERVACFINPDNPAESTLNVELDLDEILLSFLFSLLALAYAFFAKPEEEDD